MPLLFFAYFTLPLQHNSSSFSKQTLLRPGSQPLIQFPPPLDINRSAPRYPTRYRAMSPNSEPTASAPVDRVQGYIVRITLADGKRIYKPEFICNLSNWPHTSGWSDGCWHHLRLQRNPRNQKNGKYYWIDSHSCSNTARQIALTRYPAGRWSPNLNQQMSLGANDISPTKKPVQRSKMSPRRAHVSDDPNDDGRDLARSEVGLPSDRRLNVDDDSEQAQIAELYRRGILYDTTAPPSDITGEAEFGLNDIQHDEPIYTVRLAKRRARKSSPSRRAQDPDRTEDELIFVPQELWEQMSTISDMDGFELVMEDDLMSVAESWVDLDDERT